MKKVQNLQDAFLNEVRREGTPLTVFFVNGFQMRGCIHSFDDFTVLMESDGRQQLLYKHAISTIAPARPLKVLQTVSGEGEIPQGELALR